MGLLLSDATSYDKSICNWSLHIWAFPVYSHNVGNLRKFQRATSLVLMSGCIPTFEPRHDKTNKVSVHPVKTQISLGICPVWSGSSLSARRKLGSLATHEAHSEDSDQTGRMPRLIWVFAGHTVTSLGFVISRLNFEGSQKGKCASPFPCNIDCICSLIKFQWKIYCNKACCREYYVQITGKNGMMFKMIAVQWFNIFQMVCILSIFWLTFIFLQFTVMSLPIKLAISHLQLMDLSRRQYFPVSQGCLWKEALLSPVTPVVHGWENYLSVVSFSSILPKYELHVQIYQTFAKTFFILSHSLAGKVLQRCQCQNMSSGRSLFSWGSLNFWGKSNKPNPDLKIFDLSLI